MTNTRATNDSSSRICQGDIFRDVEFIDSIREESGILKVEKIIFPLVVVMTQDCDLEQDHRFRTASQNTDDKKLFSVLVVPLYNAAHVFKGEHLADLGLQMEPITENKSPGKYLKNNERPRYHYLEFPATIPLVPSIADFKHYFSVNLAYLEDIRATQFVCTISELFREDLSQRFAAYLARIGLPEIVASPAASAG